MILKGVSNLGLHAKAGVGGGGGTDLGSMLKNLHRGPKGGLDFISTLPIRTGLGAFYLSDNLICRSYV